MVILPIRYGVLTVLCCFIVISLCHAEGIHRSKRNLWQFRSMVNCLSDIGCMAYNGYGCWCGRGHSGQGKTLDHIDECCKKHDLCYKEARFNGCTFYKHPKVVLYDYIKDCDKEMILCTDPAKSCDLQVCKCDRQAAFCFAEHAASYNPILKDLNSQEKERMCSS